MKRKRSIDPSDASPQKKIRNPDTVSIILERLEQMLEKEQEKYGELSDVKFILPNDEVLWATKELICTNEVMRKMFEISMQESAKPHVVTEEHSKKDFMEFLRFLYSGVARIEDINQALALLLIANKYDCTALADDMVAYILNKPDVVQILIWLLSLGIPMDSFKQLRTVYHKTLMLFKEDSLTHLKSTLVDKSQMIQLLQQGIFIGNEEEMFDYLIEWAKIHSNNGAGTVCELLSPLVHHIFFENMSPTYLHTVVEPLELLSFKQLYEICLKKFTNISNNEENEVTITYIGGEIYTGSLKDNMPCGKGTLAYSVNERYVGDFVAARWHGKGEHTWLDGDKYSGYFQNCKKNGVGTYTWPNGSSYAGTWTNDNMHGVGVYTSINGTVLEGLFADDIPVGTHTVTINDAEKTTFEIDWTEFNKENTKGILEDYCEHALLLYEEGKVHKQ